MEQWSNKAEKAPLKNKQTKRGQIRHQKCVAFLCGKLFMWAKLAYISSNCYWFYAKFVTIYTKAQAGLHDIFWTCNQLFFGRKNWGRKSG